MTVNFNNAKLLFTSVLAFSFSFLPVTKKCFAEDSWSPSEKLKTEQFSIPHNFYYQDGTVVDLPLKGYSLKAKTLLRSSYSYAYTSADLAARPVSSFSEDNARIDLHIEALGNVFSIDTQAEFSDNDQNEGNPGPSLRDTFVSYHPCDCSYLRAGQFKVPTSRQALSDVSDFQLLSRSAVARFFDQGRQSGFEGGIKLLDEHMLLRGGIWNGLGAGEGINRDGTDRGHLVGATVAYQMLRPIDTLTESDLHSSEPGLDFNLGYFFERNSPGASSIEAEAPIQKHLLNVGAVFKAYGFSLQSEYFFQHENFVQTHYHEPKGFYFQTGYFLIPNVFELALRNSWLKEDLSINPNAQNVSSAALNWFVSAKHLKLQLGFDHSSRAKKSEDKNKNALQLAATLLF